MLILKEKSKIGPEPRYSDADIYWTLYLLSQGRRMSRKEIAYSMDIGEGSMRKIISLLKECDLIDVYQTGAVVTDLGMELLKRIPVTPVDVDIPGSVVGTCHESVVVKGAAHKIRVGREQRDAGIRAGAMGCTTVIFRNGKLTIPPDWVLDDRSPEIAREVRRVTQMKDEDALLIGSGSDRHGAINAVVSAAFELI